MDIEKERNCEGLSHRAWHLVGQPITSQYLDQRRPPPAANAAASSRLDGQGDTIMANAAANAAAAPIFTPPAPPDPSILMLAGER
jgi:hypothetical protein